MTEEKNPQPIKYIPFRSFPSRLYAEMLQEALEKEGIPSLIKSNDIGIMLGSYSTISPVEVMLWVAEDDFERAEKIANEMLNHI
jgi:hypothetical protein